MKKWAKSRHIFLIPSEVQNSNKLFCLPREQRMQMALGADSLRGRPRTQWQIGLTLQLQEITNCS